MSILQEVRIPELTVNIESFGTCHGTGSSRPAALQNNNKLDLSITGLSLPSFIGEKTPLHPLSALPTGTVSHIKTPGLMTVLGKSKGQGVRSLRLRAGPSMQGHEADSWWASSSSALTE